MKGKKIKKEPGLVLTAVLLLLLAGLNIYEDPYALDLSLVPRLFGLLLVLAGAVVFLALSPAADQWNLRPLANPVVVCYGLYVAITFGSLGYALNASAGFTEVFKAYGCFVFLCMLCAWLPTVSTWREKLLQAVVCGLALSAGLGWYEFFTHFGVTLPSRGAIAASVLGGMSNVNLYAGFLALALPVCVSALFFLKGWWRWGAIVVSLAVFSMVVLLQTRSAYLGLAGSSAVALILVVVFARRLGITQRMRWWVAAVGGLMAAGVLVFVACAPESNPVALRLRTFLTGGADATLGARFMAWKITLQMIADHFPWGVGPGNFTVRLDEYFNAGTDFRGEGTNWIHPHNDYLAVLAEQGLAGILAYLGIFLSAAWNCLCVLRSENSRIDGWLAIGILAALVAYLLDSAFNFPLARVNHQVYLAAFLAVSVLLVAQPRTNPPAPKNKKVFGVRWAFWPIFGILVVGILYSRAAIQQEFKVFLAMTSAEMGKWKASLVFAREASTPWKTLDPFATPTAYHEAKAWTNLGHPKEALEALERAYKHNPNRIHIINDLGSEYAIVGRFAEAIKLLSTTVRRYPNQVDSAENLGQCYMDSGNFVKAIETFEAIPEDKREASVRTKLEKARSHLQEQQKRNQPVPSPPEGSVPPTPANGPSDK